MPTSLHEGAQALITGGPFTGRVGTITRIDSDSLTVVVDVFERDTPVNVDFGDVKPPPSTGTAGDPEPRLPMPFIGSAGLWPTRRPVSDADAVRAQHIRLRCYGEGCSHSNEGDPSPRGGIMISADLSAYPLP